MSDPAIDTAYDVRATVSPEEFTRLIAAYRTTSERAVAGMPGRRDLRYDPDSDERLDVWGTAPGEVRPVVVVLHGGYWRRLSRHDCAFMAPLLAEHGVATVSVDYTLATRVTLEEIVRQVRVALAWVYRNGAGFGLDPGQIFVAGHSAGGHLAMMTALPGWQSALGLPDDLVKGACVVSALFDLRPLVDSFANAWLSLDPKRAAALSPALLPPGDRLPVVVAAAEHDGLGFLEQARAFHGSWRAHSPSTLVEVPDRNHYDLILDLAEPTSQLSTMLLDLVLGRGPRV